jgi:hypothetical protein
MHSQISTSYTLHSVVSTSITHSLISRSSTLTPYYHIPLPYITNFVINANHPISQSTPSHLAMCQYVECHLLFLVLLPLVECWSVHMPHCLGKPSGVEHTTPHHTTPHHYNVALCVIPWCHTLHYFTSSTHPC